MPPVLRRLAQCQLSRQTLDLQHRSLATSRYSIGLGWYLLTVVAVCRLAFADTRYYVGDPAFTDIPVEGMLDPEYGRARAQLIDPAKASVDVLRGPMHWIASVSLSGRLLVW